MICYVTSRFQNIIPCFQRILIQNQCLYSLKKSIPTREFSSAFPNIYSDDKYGELRNRLAAVPYLKMLEKEDERARHDSCYEEDERLKDVLKWYSKIFDYNARTGKKSRTAALLKAYCTYGYSMDDSTWHQWDSDRWRSAVMLAWCVELLQACYIVMDDIMDQSVSRRGKPCWYTKPDVGLRAINDGMFFRSAAYKLLQNHFADSKCYVNLLHEFFQVDHISIHGQCLDMMFNPKNQKPRFDMFTFETYQTLTEYKTAHYTFCLPVHLAMHLAGEYSAKEFEFTRELCLKLGLYYGIQNDYLDCFGKPEVFGKIGNDIAEGKCTWCSVKFLEAASEPMKKEFFENYGVDDKDAISNVMELYRKTNLIEKFEETELQISAEISRLIESRNDIKGALFYDLFAQLQNIYS